MHLRKLVSIEELIASAGAGAGERPSPRPVEAGRAAPRAIAPPPVARPTAALRPEPVERSSPGAASRVAAAPIAAPAATPRAASAPAPAPQAAEPRPAVAASDPAGFKDALLAQIKSGKPVFYNMVVAQAQKIEVAADRVTFTFSPNQRALRDTFEQNRGWLESVAQQVAGRRIAAACVVASPADAAEAAAERPAAERTAADKKSALRQQALADAGVQTMLEIFPAEISDVEEM
jgi:hypothetical protein